MRTDVAESVRLKDYRVPDYLIDKLDLDVKLHPAATRVTARLTIRPNPQGRPNAALVLDGDGLFAMKAALDGRALDLHQTEAWSGVVTPVQFTLKAPTPPPVRA
jgi:aminopeptidase N